MLEPDDAENKSNTAEATISSMWCWHAKNSNRLSNAFCVTVIAPVWTPVLHLWCQNKGLLTILALLSIGVVHPTAFPIRRPVPDPGNFGIANNLSTFSQETTIGIQSAFALLKSGRSFPSIRGASGEKLFRASWPMEWRTFLRASYCEAVHNVSSSTSNCLQCWSN